MIPRSRFAGLTWFGILAVGAALFAPAAAHAQDKQFALRFSSKSGDPSPRASLPLRPNLVQDFFVYIDNLNAQAAALRVEVQAGGKPVDGGSVVVNVAADKKITPVVLGKPPQPAQPATPPPAPAPAAPPAPPALAEVKGALTVALFDAENKLIDEVPLNVAQPKDYVQVTKISYIPKPGSNLKNQLRIELKAKTDTFAGPPARVELVLDPQRVPGLVDVQKAGTRSGVLGEAGAELVLTAENLTFPDAKEENGFVYLTIDGWQRAFSFITSFPREGTESSPEPVNTPVVHLLAPRSANPANPLKVWVEADNLGAQVIELGFDRDNDGKFSKLNGEIQDFAGNRLQKMWINPAFPGGALQVKPEVKDWATEIDVAGVVGARTMRVRLLKNAAEAAKVKDEDRAVDENMNKAFAGRPVTELRQTVYLDGTPPEGVKFINMPPRLVRGSSLPVSAAGFDPESGIRDVLFFVGKPGPDGKLPANAIQAVGQLADKEKGVWSALLDAPTEQKGKLEIGVQFVNFAGLVTTEQLKIELVDPGKDGAGAGGKASIQGKVIDPAGRVQGPGIPVQLLDDKGAVKDTVATDDKSSYLFKDVIPGSYTVRSVRTGNNTKGQITVGVKDGEKKVDVDVKLSR